MVKLTPKSGNDKVVPDDVTEANVKLSGSKVQELRDWRYELEDSTAPPIGGSSEFIELSEPDQADRPDLFNKGVAPVFPSMSLGCNKLPSWDFGHLVEPVTKIY